MRPGDWTAEAFAAYLADLHAPGPNASSRAKSARKSADLLRELVELADMPQAAVAARLGISPRQFRRYLSTTAPVRAPYPVQFAVEALAVAEAKRRATETP
jgi:hypothetical protein